MIGDDVTIGPIRLINGDMREVLPGLDVAADMLLTDPPYRITSGGNTSGEMRGCFAHGTYDNSGELFPIVEWDELAPLVFDALAPDADAVVMCSDREEAAARAALLEAGFGFHRLLVWDKRTATPNRWYMPNCEFALYLWKGSAKRIRNCASKALITCPQRDVTDHPTEKPVALMRHWLENSTDPGDLVLEPFSGSGSTVVAAALSGRRAVGIELNPRYFEIACERVEAALSGAQSGLFDAPAAAAEQGALFPGAAE